MQIYRTHAQKTKKLYVVFHRVQYLDQNYSLFILVIYEISSTLKFRLFADDTNICSSGYDINDICVS